MTKNRMQFTFILECSLASIIIGVAYLLRSNSLQTPLNKLIIAVILFVLALCLKKHFTNPTVSFINSIARLLLVALFPATLLTAISILAHPFVGNQNGQKWLVLIISLSVFLGLLVPYIQQVIGPTSGITWQIITSVTFMLLFTLTAETSKAFGFQMSYTDPLVLFAIIFVFFIMMYTMKMWGYQLPRWGINSKVNYWWLLLASITALLNWGLSAGSWSQLFFHFNLAFARTSLVSIMFVIIWTGLKEEFIFRYLVLWPLLTTKIKSEKSRILVAILISSGIFGLFHTGNMFNGQSILETFLQIFAAFGVGMLFSVITLYTGNIWIVVTLHSMIDLIGYPMTNAGPFSGSMSSYEIEFIIITRIIELIVVFLMLNNHKVQEAFKQTLGNIKSTNEN